MWLELQESTYTYNIFFKVRLEGLEPKVKEKVDKKTRQVDNNTERTGQQQ